MKNLIRIFIALALPAVLTLPGCNPFEEDALPLRNGSAVVLQDDAFIAIQNKALRLNVLANDSVFTNGTLLFRQPAHGTITSDSAGFVYRPNVNYLGKDQFYYLFNTSAGADSAKVSVTVIDSASNCPINAVNDNATVPRGQQTDIYVLNNDQVCGNETVTLVTQGVAGGAYVMPNKPVIVYWSSVNSQAQTDTFSYIVTNPAGISRRALVSVQITPAGCTPQPVIDYDSTAVNTSILVKPLLNDNTCGSNATLFIQNQPTHGTATLLSNSEIRYTPDPNFTGSDNFHYRVCIPGGACNSGLVFVSVGEPSCIRNFTANTDTVQVPANAPGTSIIIDVLKNDIVCPSPAPTMTIWQNPNYGTASVVMVNGKPRVNYLKTNPPGLQYSDVVWYQISTTYNGQVTYKTAMVLIHFN